MRPPPAAGSEIVMIYVHPWLKIPLKQIAAQSSETRRDPHWDRTVVSLISSIPDVFSLLLWPFTALWLCPERIRAPRPDDHVWLRGFHVGRIRVLRAGESDVFNAVFRINQHETVVQLRSGTEDRNRVVDESEELSYFLLGNVAVELQAVSSGIQLLRHVHLVAKAYSSSMSTQYAVRVASSGKMIG